MPLTITVEHSWREKQRAHAIIKVTFPNPYTVGGETLDLSAQMKEIWNIEGKVTEDADGYVIGFDDTNFGSGGTKVLLFFGDYTEVADGPLIELTAIDTSGVSARLHAIGAVH